MDDSGPVQGSRTVPSFLAGILVPCAQYGWRGPENLYSHDAIPELDETEPDTKLDLGEDAQPAVCGAYYHRSGPRGSISTPPPPIQSPIFGCGNVASGKRAWGNIQQDGVWVRSIRINHHNPQAWLPPTPQLQPLEPIPINPRPKITAHGPTNL